MYSYKTLTYVPGSELASQGPVGAKETVSVPWTLLSREGRDPGREVTRNKGEEGQVPCRCRGTLSGTSWKPGLPGRGWRASTSGSRCRGPRDWGAEWGAQPGTREEPACLCPRGPRGVCKRHTKSERLVQPWPAGLRARLRAGLAPGLGLSSLLRCARGCGFCARRVGVGPWCGNDVSCKQPSKSLHVFPKRREDLGVPCSGFPCLRLQLDSLLFSG